MKVGIIQMAVSADKQTNLDRASQHIRDAAGRGADLVILGEMFCCPYENAAFTANAETREGPSTACLSRAARENGVYLVGGSIPLLEDGRLYNASFVFDRSGRVIAVHRKVHLFDIDVEGGQYFKESDTFTAGNEVTLFDTEFGKMGLCICFDFRFPELARIMALEGARCIFVPAAFNMTTGPAHWELMFRQRAVDNQCFTVGVSPARDETASYVAYGHSIAVDPWGSVLRQAGSGEATLYADLDLRRVDAIRRQLPILSARREDLYEVRER